MNKKPSLFSSSIFSHSSDFNTKINNLSTESPLKTQVQTEQGQSMPQTETKADRLAACLANKTFKMK